MVGWEWGHILEPLSRLRWLPWSKDQSSKSQKACPPQPDQALPAVTAKYQLNWNHPTEISHLLDSLFQWMVSGVRFGYLP